MNTRKPPFSPDAEKAVIGSVISKPSFYNDVSLYVSSKTIFDPANKHMWGIITNMIHSGKDIDLVTICGALTEEDKLKSINAYTVSGYQEYAIDDIDRVMVYAKEVYEKHLMRLTIQYSSDLVQVAYDNPSNLFSVLNGAGRTINELISMLPMHPFDIDSEMDNAIQSIGEQVNLIPVGFDSIDDLSGGMTRGEISIIGGRPGHCKTTLALNIIKNLITSGLRVLVFNREMTNIEMLKKLLVLESGNLSYKKIRRGDLSEFYNDEINRVYKHIKQKYNSDVFMMCDNVFDMASASTIINRFKPDVIVDDYIQLIKPDNITDQRRFQIESIVHQYKRLSKTVNCATILLSQLSRGVEMRGKGARPMLSDLAESGTIEQVAENIWLLYYDYKIFLNKSQSGANEVDIICAKVRYGTNAVVHCGYDGDRIKMYNSIDDFRSTLF